MKINTGMELFMKQSESERYHVPNLERALSILELLAKHPGGLSMIEIAGMLGYPNNSVFRITTTLLNREYLLRDEGSKKFTLGQKMLALGFASIGENNIMENSLDVMRQLRDATKETVLLATLLDESVVVLDQVPGLHPFKFMVDAGSLLNLHTAVPGKAILANLPENERELIIKKLKLTRYNERTITTKKALRVELDRTVKQGYAIDHAEQLEGVHCVGAAVFNQHSYPIAAIWITGPAERMPKDSFESLGKQVKSYANIISQRFGYNLL
jgi:DNA-binding IclR family transcriptional regulator